MKLLHIFSNSSEKIIYYLSFMYKERKIQKSQQTGSHAHSLLD